MAECNVSIDQDKLPGVKEVCRDFAVLEDHCLAYNLQEQEIESHLASNVHKSRLVQQDLQVAKKLQEEEDEIAKVVIKKQHVAIARQDNEIAHEIQDELVRQAEQQRRQQEEKDAAMARKLHEKEMKDERRRQKQLDEEYYEDTVAVIDPEYGLGEATRDMTKLDLREQELKDMEVARRMQEEEVKASKSHVRAAQVAQDEEMARQLMEQEKKEYRKHREREKEREREREEKERQREKERAMEKRRPEAEYRPNSEDVVRPRTREEHDHQRHRNHYKPSRPPHPRTHDYENVNPSYGYVEHPHQRAPSRPEAAYKDEGKYFPPDGTIGDHLCVTNSINRGCSTLPTLLSK
nr:coiled-coil domain-containing protein 50-like [Nerophis lumbriciformis]